MKGMNVGLVAVIAAVLAIFNAETSARGVDAAARQVAPASRKITIEDFGWLSGHWGAKFDNGVEVEEFCSQPARRHMMCMFRALGADKSLGLEFITLQEKTEGLEEHIRFYSPDLQTEDPGAVTLVLKDYSPSEMTFENASGGQPKRVTLRHPAADKMDVHIELLDAQGKSSFIDAHWSRTQ